MAASRPWPGQPAQRRESSGRDAVESIITARTATARTSRHSCGDDLPKERNGLLRVEGGCEVRHDLGRGDVPHLEGDATRREDPRHNQPPVPGDEAHQRLGRLSGSPEQLAHIECHAKRSHDRLGVAGHSGHRSFGGNASRLKYLREKKTDRSPEHMQDRAHRAEAESE
eukprot:6760694-Prymnesium_polylepis.1